MKIGGIIMGIAQFTIVVLAIIIVTNGVLFYLVQKHSDLLFISGAICIAEILALFAIIWYWLRHYHGKKTSNFARLHKN